MGFVGAKIALLQGDAVLTILRDDFAHIPFPAHWDLPGGGREGAESPEACVLRELQEELGLAVAPERLIWRKSFPSVHAAGRVGWFFAARITAAEVARVRFGDEGQGWRMMPVESFLTHPKGVSFLQERLRLCLSALPG